MKVVQCDLVGCATDEDVFERVLAALKAPDWHGRNLDALWDSIAGGGINELVPPFRLNVAGSGGLRNDLRDLVDKIGNLFSDARSDRLVDVAFVLI